MFRFAVTVAAVVVTTGCGLVDSDITDFQLFVRDKQFTVDTAQWELQGVDQFTSTDCSQSAGICAVGAEQVCSDGQCFGRCDGATDTCELQILVALWQSVNVDSENPELRTLAEQPVVDVEIDNITYEITENSLTIDTPEFKVYAAPATIMSPGDPEALQVGTIAPVTSQTLVSLTNVELTSDGRDILADFMGDYQTSFNIIVATEIFVGDGDTVPTGALSANVQVRAHAGL